MRYEKQSSSRWTYLRVWWWRLRGYSGRTVPLTSVALWAIPSQVAPSPSLESVTTAPLTVVLCRPRQQIIATLSSARMYVRAWLSGRARITNSIDCLASVRAHVMWHNIYTYGSVNYVSDCPAHYTGMQLALVFTHGCTRHCFWWPPFHAQYGPLALGLNGPSLYKYSTRVLWWVISW